MGLGSAPQGPLLISHEESLINFAERRRVALAMAEGRFPSARRWHLIASVSVAVPIEAGRAIVRDIHPPVTIYGRTSAIYEAVLTVND